MSNTGQGDTSEQHLYASSINMSIMKTLSAELQSIAYFHFNSKQIQFKSGQGAPMSH